MITISKQDYLKAVAEAEAEGQTMIPATLAHWLSVTRPAVTFALKRLKKDGLVSIKKEGHISRLGAVTQFSTGADSNYNSVQLTAMRRMGHGLQGRVNYTWSQCLDQISNGGFLQFSAGEFSLHCRRTGARLRQLRLRHPTQRHRTIRVPTAVQRAQPRSRTRSERLADFRQCVLAQRGAVLRAEHAVLGKR